MTPGLGKSTSAEADGIGPNVLNRKAIRRYMWANGVRLILYKVCRIYIRKTSLPAFSEKAVSFSVALKILISLLSKL